MRSSIAVAVSLLCGAVLASCVHHKPQRPNFLFVLTDDQDAHMTSMEHMPLLNKYVASKGTIFEKHYCTIAICCPSRVSLWTGQAAHNTNVTDVSPPYGGWPKFVEMGYNEKHLALWMQNSGYNTYYTGKMYNYQRIDNYNDPYISGYNGSEILLDPFTYQYFNYTSSRNGESPVNNPNRYSVDLTAQSAYDFLEDALEDTTKPFFLTVAPIAPHSEGAIDELGREIALEPQAPERHKHLFQNYTIPRGANFNPNTPSSVGWISSLGKLSDEDIAYNDEFQRQRLRSLQSVDEMVEKLVIRLEKAGVLGNTFVIYSSDNGFHAGQHRMPPGKNCGLEEDINVPLVIRGPGVPAGESRNFPTAHIDLAPTIMKLAGNSITEYPFDGVPIEIKKQPENFPEHVQVEFWGHALFEGKYLYDDENDFTPNLGWNNTYKGVRVVAKDYGFYYSVWCHGESELYDMSTDPSQINNLVNASERTVILDRPLAAIINRLDALLMVLKSCKQQSCIEPWKSLHPAGDVRTLAEALSERFDDFYARQLKIRYNECRMGYILDAEGPQDVVPYSQG